MTAPTADRLAERTLADVPVSAIRPNPDQPRRLFRGIDELAASIRDSGLLQPITLRANADGTYVIVAGERRFRAVTTLGWPTVPAIVIDRDEEEGFRLAVLENMARKDMSPVEEAQALARLLQTMTASEVAGAVGYGAGDGGQVTWKIKLLDAIEEVQDLVNKGHLNQTKAIQASKLSRPGQLSVLRITGSQRLTDREWGALCDTIYAQENQIDMFPETKLAPEIVAERNELAEVLALLGKGAQRMSNLRIDVIMRGNRQAAVQMDRQLEEVIRGLSRVKLQIQSEAGIALALDDARRMNQMAVNEKETTMETENARYQRHAVAWQARLAALAQADRDYEHDKRRAKGIRFDAIEAIDKAYLAAISRATGDDSRENRHA